ncbi:MAG: carbonic anhydrase [Pseudomonadota bacterium]
MEIKPNYNQVLEDLIAGNNRFLSGESIKCAHSSLAKIKNFANEGQFPKAILLCCSDSRAPAEMVFDQDIGDLFVIRVAGNIVAPSLVGSVEFAVNTFGTNLVLVMGHTECGAIKATLNHIEKSQVIDSENIHDIVSRIKPHVFSITQVKTLSEEEKMLLAVKANILASVDQLSHSSRLIESLVQQGKIKVFGALLELRTGKVEIL